MKKQTPEGLYRCDCQTSFRANKESRVSDMKTATNLSMRFAVQVCEKIKHGTRGDVTVFAPVVSSVIVFKRLQRRGRGPARRFVWGRSGRRRHRLLGNKDGGESMLRLEAERIPSDQMFRFLNATKSENGKGSYLR